MKRCRKQSSVSLGHGGLSTASAGAAATVANGHVQRLKSFSPMPSPIVRYVESNDHLAACYDATHVGTLVPKSAPEPVPRSYVRLLYLILLATGWGVILLSGLLAMLAMLAKKLAAPIAPVDPAALRAPFMDATGAAAWEKKDTTGALVTDVRAKLPRVAPRDALGFVAVTAVAPLLWYRYFSLHYTAVGVALANGGAGALGNSLARGSAKMPPLPLPHATPAGLRQLFGAKLSRVVTRRAVLESALVAALAAMNLSVGGVLVGALGRAPLLTAPARAAAAAAKAPLARLVAAAAAKAAPFVTKVAAVAARVGAKMAALA